MFRSSRFYYISLFLPFYKFFSRLNNPDSVRNCACADTMNLIMNEGICFSFYVSTIYVDEHALGVRVAQLEEA